MLKTVTNSDIFTVDALHHRPQLAAIHLIRSNDRIAIVDTGTQYSVPQVSNALDELGLDFSSVDYVILTHIHLDHAGGAGVLMALCENAQLLVHPRGARHMVDPSKLVAGATAVYGQESFAKDYGQIKPVEQNRIVQPEDGQTFDFAGRPLTFIDTPGHANHHHCIVDHQSNSIFTGDTLGVGYNALRDQHHAFVMATTTPIQFNPDALHTSVDKVMSYDPQTLYLTHYSALSPSAKIIAGLHEQIDDFKMLTEQAANEGTAFETTLASELTEYLVRRCRNELPSVDEATVRDWTRFDAMLNAQGLVFWWQHQRSE